MSEVIQPSPFMPNDEVLRVTGVCMATIYNWMANGHFPAPISLTPNRARSRGGRVVWVRAEVDQWVQDQLAKPRTIVPAATRTKQSA